jgi:hypothetical protein
VAALTVTVASGCGGGSSDAAPQRLDLRGEVRLAGAPNVHGDLTTCAGVGRFSDVKAGGRVLVTDGKNRKVARGRISSGLGTNYYDNALDECTWRIVVERVPRRPTYRFVIGRHPAQQIRLSEILAARGTFSIDITPDGATAPPS